MLHAQAGYANRVYGHWATGSDRRLWLAYWFFYFYNDYNLVGPLLPAGLHEGDWEMIQLRLDEPGQAPDLAVYAQHNSAVARPWAQVERVGEQPVVYPARGSHASYFEAGIHWTGHWFDHVNGRRIAPALALEVIHDDDPAYRWATWPGMWGGTEPQPGLDRPLEDSSPRGPGGHGQWHDPSTLLGKATDRAAALQPPAPQLAVLPAPPTITLAREGEELRLHYSTSAEDIAMLIVTVNSPQEPLPPALYRVPVEASSGTVEVPAGLHDEWGYDIHISSATADGRASASIEHRFPPQRPLSELDQSLSSLTRRRARVFKPRPRRTASQTRCLGSSAPEPRRAVASAAHEAVAFVLTLVPRGAVLTHAEALVCAADRRAHITAACDPGHGLSCTCCRDSQRDQRGPQRDACSHHSPGIFAPLDIPLSGTLPNSAARRRSPRTNDLRSYLQPLRVPADIGSVTPHARAGAQTARGSVA
jgi:hypothetical protein